MFDAGRVLAGDRARAPLSSRSTMASCLLGLIAVPAIGYSRVHPQKLVACDKIAVEGVEKHFAKKFLHVKQRCRSVR